MKNRDAKVESTWRLKSKDKQTSETLGNEDSDCQGNCKQLCTMNDIEAPCEEYMGWCAQYNPENCSELRMYFCEDQDSACTKQD